MALWTVVTLLFVVGVKYYTSIEMRKLERRLEAVKNGLQKVKEKHQAAEDKLTGVQSEESSFEDRVKTMKEIIQDIQFRLSAREEEEPDTVVSDSAPPPSSF